MSDPGKWREGEPCLNEEEVDNLAIEAFANAMKRKMALARKKGRYGWRNCSPQALSIMMREHVEKGDPVDVANFCMMLWNLGNDIS